MSVATIQVLGSGTSTGVPTVGKAYPEEYLANPKNHRLRASIVVRGPTGNLLVDCTPDMRTQLLRAGIMDVEAVLITHTHADHIMGMDDLRAFCLKYRRPLAVYTLPEHAETIRRVYPYMFQDFPEGILVPRIDLRLVPTVLNVGGVDIETMVVDHGCMNCIAIKVGGFAYVTDVKTVPDTVIPRLMSLDTLVLDAVRYRAHPNHLDYYSALELVERLKPRRTYFTHLCDDYDHDVTNAALPPGVELAYDGLEIEVES